MNSGVTSAPARRLAEVRAALLKRNLQGLLVSHLPNVRYLTGFSGSNGWLLLGHHGGLLLTDGRYRAQVEAELPEDVGLDLVVCSESLLEELGTQAKSLFGGARLGFEARYLSYGDWDRLNGVADGVEWTVTNGTVESVRVRKDGDEIAAIRRAAEIASGALMETLPLVKPGMREMDIAAELDYRMARLGSEGPAFKTIVASGPRSALPHATSGAREIQPGDFLLIDFGARWSGYSSDLTRTFVLGEPEPRQSELYGLVAEAQRRALSKLRAGESPVEVDAAARDVFVEHDLEDHFPHSTGHGLGLEVHESPRLGRRSEDALEPNMVVTVEPGLYFPGWGGIRIEDDVVITESTPTSLVDLQRGHLQVLPV